MATKKSVSSLKESDLKGMRVFVRVYLNEPLDDSFKITDDTCIRAAVPTIKSQQGQRLMCYCLGIEEQQLEHLVALLDSVILSNSNDRWVSDLNGDGVFRVKDVRNLLDEFFLPRADIPTRWVKNIPIKVNIFAWKLALDRLPTRANLVQRNVVTESQSCPLCDAILEDTSHLFFNCSLARDVTRLLCRWWNLGVQSFSSYAEWLVWFNSVRLASNLKVILEGVFYVTWWSLWNFRNQLLFASKKPRKESIFDDIVLRSFCWCKARAALNPCFNVNGVDYLIESISTDLKFFDDTFASKSKSYFKESLEGLYNLYYTKYGNPTQSSQTSGGATSSKAIGGNKYSRLLSGLKAHTKKKARTTDPTMASEYERYVNSDFVTHLHPKEFASFDVLGFWKEKETMFPVLSRMAMDIISVQASSVASESAFSTSGRVLSIRRTRLTPASLEMCMCLKDHLDAKERKQDKCPLETPLDFEESVFDDEVQQNEAIPLSDEEIALDASSEGTMSPGGPRYDYMVSSEEAEDEY
ncbi:RNA-directed DNA polymerase, eukaryota [Tanacetum coccineum]